ncbi:hypothetical protein J7443_00295 [Tropicibacter sp. R15_0]|uniref:hypothetical protein n=1 Tax=Tropicibacter sp. R15_0 TaxID=2821101 RepID=UPI001ADD1573|nr:hypothetical protein [Tropicibacter sp. R15_0]MBO9463656.1 hypothetical protein [Tropicibacter sp. R15_0]
MKQSYRNAIEQGGDLIPAALGKAERLLAKSPDDPRAKAYKGSLLVLMAQRLRPPKQRIYRNSGQSLVTEALENADDSKPWFSELVFVASMSVMSLEPADATRALLKQRIKAAIDNPGFNDLSPFEKVGLLCVAAKMIEPEDASNQSTSFLTKAKETDPALLEQALSRLRPV